MFIWETDAHPLQNFVTNPQFLLHTTSVALAATSTFILEYYEEVVFLVSSNWSINIIVSKHFLFCLVHLPSIKIDQFTLQFDQWLVNFLLSILDDKIGWGVDCVVCFVLDRIGLTCLCLQMPCLAYWRSIVLRAYNRLYTWILASEVA